MYIHVYILRYSYRTEGLVRARVHTDFLTAIREVLYIVSY